MDVPERNSPEDEVRMKGVPDPIPKNIEVIDSHTGGEPTRIVLSGWPQPLGDTIEARRDYLLHHHDRLRTAVVCEPRGHDAIVGGLLTPAVHPNSDVGIIFFNDVGYLGMCGHGLIGLAETLRFLDRISGNRVQIDTPVGPVTAVFEQDGKITIANVPSYLYKKDVTVDIPDLGKIKGDIAYGGNWFFLVHRDMGELRLSNLDDLMANSKTIRRALQKAGITGEKGAVVDHIEFYGPPDSPHADSRNFVLCPGNAYDRSCCGTGTSAKMAVLHARGQLEEGQVWTQESVTGSIFEGWLEKRENLIIPHIRSSAHVVARATLFFDSKDEFCWGIG